MIISLQQRICKPWNMREHERVWESMRESNREFTYRCKASKVFTEYNGDLGSLCWISMSALVVTSFWCNILFSREVSPAVSSVIAMVTHLYNNLNERYYGKQNVAILRFFFIRCKIKVVLQCGNTTIANYWKPRKH